MKRIFSIITAAILTATIWAQSPQKMSYQAVIRNGSDQLVTKHAVGMRISILQDVTPVYVETHATTSNANGLVTVEIGNGSVISGDFTTIDWSAGEYSIKTETDPTGGTNYTAIVGTSQLLSVPYALYAKTAGSTNGTSGHYVGELYGGGVVFWVDHSGQHGLIVSMVDLSTAQAWSNITATLIGTTNDWDGVTNTTAIIEQGGHTSSAAKLCNDYTNADYGTGTYSDWYLPGIAELNHVWNSFYEVQKALTNDGNGATTPLVRNYYWSSSETHFDDVAWSFTFFNGTPDYGSKTGTYSVRAVRAF